MSTSKYYMFDNNTGIDIPKKIDVYPVELVLGSTISKVHESITPCQLFCVFTPIADADIIVQTNDDVEIIQSILNFGKKDYKVIYKESSIWYSNKAEKNIIFSNSIKLSASDIGSLLKLYLNDISNKKKASKDCAIIETYTVMNIRNTNQIFKTPNFTEAKDICNKSPCCVVLNNASEIIYKSLYGKVSISNTKENHINKFKASLPNNNGIFKIKI